MDREEYQALYGLVQESVARLMGLEGRLDRLEERQTRLEEGLAEVHAELHQFRIEVRDRRLFELENRDK